MPARGRNGRFKKGGGSRRRSKGRRRTSAPKTIVRRVTVATARPRRRRRGGGLLAGGGGSHGMPSVRTLGVASLVGFATTSPNPHAVKFQGYVDKVPGARTFSRPAAVGIAAWAVNRYLKPHPLLREVAHTGLIIGAGKLGESGY